MSDTGRLPAFDDEVVRAMRKWPDVPQCFGWLSLDRRGRWLIRGDRIGHARACAFLSRHYRGDAHGRWYVQNGPQQVFVDLEYTPWVLRYHAAGGFTTHTGLACDGFAAAHIDEQGNLLLAADIGIALVDDRDLEACSSLLECGDDDVPRRFLWRGRAIAVEPLERRDVPKRYGFVPSPHSDPG